MLDIIIYNIFIYVLIGNIIINNIIFRVHVIINNIIFRVRVIINNLVVNRLIIIYVICICNICINIDNNNKEANSNNETLVSLESTSTDINTINDFHKAQKYDKPVANFIKKDDVRISSLSQEELNTFQKIQNATGDNNVSIFYDETGTMTKTVRDDFNNYSKVDDIDGEDHLVSQESSKSQGIAKQKVLTTSSRKPTNISAAFTNTLILSFIIGSFFGVVFLAIYLKVMH